MPLEATIKNLEYVLANPDNPIHIGYIFNKDYYKDNFSKFAGESAEMVGKNLVPAALSYVLYSPIAAAFTFYGATPASAAFYSSVLTALFFIAGSNAINQRLLKHHRFVLKK